jgi:enoyl-CoA hydratase/carnithine racemase
MESTEGKVRGMRDGAIGWIVFDNQSRLNAYSSEMAGQALELVKSYESDQDLRVVILRGAGEKAFISGGDISKFEETRFEADAARLSRKNSEVLRDQLVHFPKPVIAMIHGYCLGGGMAIALCADIRFGASSAQLGIPAALRGLAYPTPSLNMLVNLIGPSISKDLMFSGRRMKADEALRVGLLNAVFDPEQLEERTVSYANSLAQNAPLSIRASKYCIDQLILDEEKQDHVMIKQLQDQAANSADFKEATTAFMEKRKPVFRGI